MRTHVHREATLERREALLAEALAVLERDYAEDLEVDEVARRIATSRRQLQRCFEEHAGGSFRQSLARIRMERAAELLRTTRLPVREVAGHVGYRQPAQFAKAFARYKGEPPSRFRARDAQPVAA